MKIIVALSDSVSVFIVNALTSEALNPIYRYLQITNTWLTLGISLYLEGSDFD